MKSKHWLLIGALIIVVAIVAVAAANLIKVDKGGQDNTGNLPTTDTGNTGNGEVQVVKVTMDNGWKYVMTPSTLKKGVKARLEFDMTKVTGCMRSVVIPAFGVREYLTPQDNIIEFVPDKTGTFKIACAMNMGTGSFSVVE